MRITIGVGDIERTGWHRWHNFGEDLWRALVDERRVRTEALRRDMDQPVKVLTADLPARLAGRVSRRISALLADHCMSDEVEVSCDGTTAD
ncbi:MAG: hypothetical protein AAF577_08345 [Pseudomonadota bacterium]